MQLRTGYFSNATGTHWVAWRDIQKSTDVIIMQINWWGIREIHEKYFAAARDECVSLANGLLLMKYFFPFLSDSGYNAININNWSACGQETFDVKKQNQKKRLVTSVFAWQSSRCDLTITRRIGRNGIPLRSIFARCILLRCWWSKCNCDFKDLGKKRITAERNQKTIWFKRGSAAWRKRRKV